jgi:hypothetical protein
MTSLFNLTTRHFSKVDEYPSAETFIGVIYYRHSVTSPDEEITAAEIIQSLILRR